MKKALLIIAVIAVLSGCGTNDSLTCSTENTLGNISSSTTYKIDYRDNDSHRREKSDRNPYR